MANLSYCKMQNTYPDLEDCYEALQDKLFDDFSEEEQRFAKKLIELCGKISNDFDYLITD